MQAETQLKAADGAATARVPETCQWLLVPVQDKPQMAIEWQAMHLLGQHALAVRASKKLRNDELLLINFAPSRLRVELDRVPLWRDRSVAIKQVAEDFGRYLCMPRLADSSVLINAIRDGFSLLTWGQDSFAFAVSHDEARKRYRSLRAGETVSIADAQLPGLLVEPDVARAQINAARAIPTATGVPGTKEGDSTKGGTGAATLGSTAATGKAVVPAAAPKPTRFHGTSTLDTARVGRDASRTANEVIAHLAGLVGAEATVTIEIEATIPGGVPDNIVLTVTDNNQTLKSESHGFEVE